MKIIALLIIAVVCGAVENYEEIKLVGGGVMRGWYDEATGTLRLDAGSVKIPPEKIINRRAVDPPTPMPTPTATPSAQPRVAVPKDEGPMSGAPVVSLVPMTDARKQELAAEKAAKESKDAENKRIALEGLYRDVWGVAYQVNMEATVRVDVFPEIIRGKYIPISWKPGDPKTTEFRQNTEITRSIGETVVEEKKRTTVHNNILKDNLGRIHIIEGDKEVSYHTVYGVTNETGIIAVWWWLDVNGDRRGIDMGPSFFRVVR